MRKLRRWLVLGVLGLLVVGVLARNFIARKSVEVSVTKVTGFPLKIGAVNVGLFTGQLDATGLKVMNPPEFDDKQFIDLPKLHVDYRLGSLLTGAPHIKDMLVDIQHIALVKNAKGESNAQKLNGVTAASSGTAGKSSTKYRIDQLRIHIGTVTYKDFSRAKATERTYALNSTVVYKDIADSTDIARLVLLTLLSQTPLPDIGIRPDDLKKNLSNAAAEAGQGLFDKVKQAIPPQ